MVHIDSHRTQAPISPPPPAKSRRRKALLAAAVALGLIMATAVLWRRSSIPPKMAAHEDGCGELEEQPVENPGYVGLEACAACHAERAAEFRSTNHFRTFRVPDSAAMPAGFEPGKGTYVSQVPGLRFEMRRQGDEFFQTAIRSTASGTVKSTARIDLVLGAGGKADEVYLTWRDGRLYELPVAWLFTFDCWGASHVSPHNTGNFTRESTLRCLECHNTWFAHVPGTLNEYRPDSFLMGVTCENCHGPGREHVAHHQVHPGADSGEQIVRPARLSRERQIEVCTQCHSNSMQHRGPAFSHRPGTPLDSDYRTLRGPTYTEDDHVANQIKYLRQSRCFQNSEELTCTTCHDPHRPEAATVSGRDSCLKCHARSECGDQERLPVAVRDNCAGCHMPAYVKINVNFETEDDNYVPPIRRCDHRIAVHPRSRQEVLLNWYRAQADADSRIEAERLAGELSEQWLAEADACRRHHRVLGTVAALREADRIAPALATREKLRQAVALVTDIETGFDEAVRQLDEGHYSTAIEQLERLLQLKPDLAKAHGRLGTAYAAIGERDKARAHWRAVEEFDPDNPYGEGMLGWLAYLDGDSQQAIEAFERADTIEPYNSQTHYHWGLALLNLEKWAQAAEHFQQVVTIDPRHAGGWQGLSHAQRRGGQPGQALCAALRAARLTGSENYDVLLTLSDAYADLGRFPEASDAADQALRAAEAHAPVAAPRVRRRLDELKSRARVARR